MKKKKKKRKKERTKKIIKTLRLKVDCSTKKKECERVVVNIKI